MKLKWKLMKNKPTIATCIGCGCDDANACEGGCGWISVNRETQRGVCTRCPQHQTKFLAEQSPPEEIRLNIGEKVNELAIMAAKLMNSLSATELAKFAENVRPQQLKIKNDADGLKKSVMLVGFMYVEAMECARRAHLAKTKTLPG